MLEGFAAWNRSICRQLERLVPHRKNNAFQLYNQMIRQHLNHRPNQLVLDCGAGRSCSFAKRSRSDQSTKIIAIDWSAEQLQSNMDVDGRIAADLMAPLPFQSEQFDLVVSRCTLEHLPDLEPFVAESRRVLRREGLFVHVFPCRFAPFAWINRALPHGLARRLVHRLQPDTEQLCGFRTYYDHCYDSAFKTMLSRHGFQILEVRHAYYQSRYYDFFVPLYAISCTYEMVVRSLGLRNLCAYLLVAARRD